jgi:hypothetical protein
MAWHAPDGVSGGHTSTSFCLGVGACVSLNDFPPAISGPGGSWSWSWLGVADFRASTILGAYAPVGDDWAGFRP